VDFRQDRDGDLHPHRGRRDAVQLSRLPFGRRRSLHLRLARHHARVGASLRLARDPDRRGIRVVVKRVLIVFVAAFAMTLRGLAQTPPKQAVVETSLGTFVIDLTPEGAPNQTAYFMKTAADGGYDGTIFHRVIKYGMVQGGDPLTKDASKRAQYGTGGLNAVKAEARAAKMTRGSVAAVMVPGKPDSAGSQFFIVLADQPSLDHQYT